ncbi:DNA-binding transcriptional regulator GbsR (MarR family) [Paenibacillus sp. DS2015]|uniref:hypothetical protein n=1 Tax=Paenibacillus sp. DS2015 TaxID=3373917 RepID=UPI003D20DFBA
MIDRIQKISNPLTIVAIFAGLAEVAGTVALGLIAQDIQKVFIWFVMLFPIILVMAFFILLWFKPQSLYAPSDYKNEENFVSIMDKTKSVKEQIEEALQSVNNSKLELQQLTEGQTIDDNQKEKIIATNNEYLEGLTKNLRSIQETVTDLTTSPLNELPFLTESEFEIYLLISQNPRIALTDICEIAGSSSKFIQNKIKSLIDINLVKTELVNGILLYSTS